MPAPRLHLLARTIVSTWHGDWPAFRATVATARDANLPRAELEETLLQAVLFCGFPRVVSAFEELERSWPVPMPPQGGGLPTTEQAAAGRSLFAAIYGRNDAAVRGMLQRFHGEFHDFVLDAAYGRILARPGLSAHDREVIACAVLAAQEQKRQFVAHARGALHFGATREDLQAVLCAAFAGATAAETSAAELAERWLQLVR